MRRLTRLSLIVFLFWIGRVAAADASVLFNDDFNRTGGLGSDWQVYFGSYTTDGNNAVSQGTVANWAAITPNLNTDDYTVESVLTVPAGSLYSGVVARGNPSTGFYRDLYAAQIATDGTVNLYRRNASAWTLLKSAPASIAAGIPYTLTLKVSGSNPVSLEVSLNGDVLIDYQDSSASRLLSGLPGMENYNSNVKYDRFTVSSFAVGNQPPIARIAPPTPSSGTVPLQVHFDGTQSSDSDGTITSYAWDFGDGSSGSGATADHTYATAGNFTVTLTVTDNQGATGAAHASVTVFSQSSGSLFNDEFTRTGGLGSNWQVYFGSFITDGNNAVSQGTVANWAAITPALNTNDYTVESVLTIPSGSLYSGIVARGNPATGFLQDLYAAQIATDGTVNLYRRNAYAWTLLKSAAAGIVANQTYTLRLKVSGSNPVNLEVSLNGTSLYTYQDSSASQILSGIPGVENYNSNVKYDRFTVYSNGAAPINQPPSAKLSANPTFGSAPLSVHFDGSASFDPDGSIVSYAWNFGDNTSGNGVTFDHLYTAAGSYTATLTVTDNQGAQGLAQTQIVVSASGATSFIDNFDRSDSTNLGPGWNEYLPDLEIFSNQVRNVSGNSQSAAAVENLAIGPNQDVSVDCKIVLPGGAADNGNSCAVMARWSSESNFYHALFDVGRQSIALFSTVNGTTTLLGKVNTSLQYDTFYRIRLLAQGSSLQLFFNGNVVLTISDASLTAGNFAGIRAFNGLADSVYFDNFSASAVTGTPADQPPVPNIAVNLSFGTAPLSIHFDGSRSFDPDGSIISYRWNFGDGSIITGSASITDHTYTTASGAGPIPSFVERVSVSATGGEANGNSSHAALNRDGRYVAFESDASNLVPNDTNNKRDVFVYDRQTKQITRVSISSADVEGNGDSSGAKLSGDGRYVVFESEASNLVPNDTNNVKDIFIHDLQTGTTTRVSVDSAGNEGNGLSSYAFTNADGRYVSFYSSATNLVPNDTNGANDIFVHDMVTGQTTRVNVDSAGSQSSAGSDSYCPSISDDGRYVFFLSNAVNLVSGGANGAYQAYVHDRQSGTTVRVSVDSNGVQGNANTDDGKISADGRTVLFESDASNLVPNDTNNASDIFLHDLQTGVTTRVSISSSGAQANGESFDSRVSDNGRFAAFESDATNLVSNDTNLLKDIFIHDRVTGATTRMSVSVDGFEANGGSQNARISGDGRFVAFDSDASNLVAGDRNSATDIFVVPGPGTDTATLTVTDNNGATGSARVVILVNPAGNATLFSDEFNRTGGLGSNWQVYFGSFTTDGNNAVSQGSVANWAAITPNLNTSDYTVESALTIPAGSLYSGIVARGNPATGFYRDLYAAQIATDGTVNLYRRNAYAWTLLKSAAAGIVANQTYTLRLKVSGSNPVNLEVSLNGTSLYTYQDSSASQILSGIPGLENYNSNVKYDRFTVTGP